MEAIGNYLELIQPYFVIVVLIIAFYAIYRDWVIPVKGMFIAVLVFLFTGIISLQNLLEGLANQAIATILLLIVVAAVLNKQFNLTGLFDRLIIHQKGYKPFIASMMFATSLLSSFMNNTAVVALMSNYVYDWGVDKNISPSKLLMPLSFSAITGGMITIIGTSTTLILIGFMETYGVGSLDWWKLLLLGSVLSIAAIVYFLTIGPRLLPNHVELVGNLKKNPREYLAELNVEKGSLLIGKSLSEGRLRNLSEFYLVEIIRDDKIISPVPQDAIILENDRLFFAGDPENIQSLIKVDPHLKIPGYDENEESRLSITEAVLAYNSSLIGRSIRDSRFRQRYDAAVLAVHRNGEKLRGKIGNIVLRSGDVLLLSSGLEFNEKVDVYKDLYVISTKKLTQPLDRKKRLAFFTISTIALILLITQLLPLLTSLLILFAFLVVFDMINLRTIKRELDINLGAILVLALAMGKAITESGAAHLISEQVIILAENMSPFGVLVIMILLTALLTTFITNVAAVSIAFPIAYDIATYYPDMASELYLGIAFAASAAFLTPISYQTNLIVAGPGGYRFSDFGRAGGPLFVIYLAILLLAFFLF